MDNKAVIARWENIKVATTDELICVIFYLPRIRKIGYSNPTLIHGIRSFLYGMYGFLISMVTIQQ